MVVGLVVLHVMSVAVPFDGWLLLSVEEKKVSATMSDDLFLSVL